MKEFNIKLNEDRLLECSDGQKCNEIDMLVQIWQDINRLSQTSDLLQEDLLVKNILEQILEKEYGSIKDIPIPDYYTYHERHSKTD